MSWVTTTLVSKIQGSNPCCFESTRTAPHSLDPVHLLILFLLLCFFVDWQHIVAPQMHVFVLLRSPFTNELDLSVIVCLFSFFDVLLSFFLRGS